MPEQQYVLYKAGKDGRRVNVIVGDMATVDQAWLELPPKDQDGHFMTEATPLDLATDDQMAELLITLDNIGIHPYQSNSRVAMQIETLREVLREWIKSLHAQT